VIALIGQHAQSHPDGRRDSLGNEHLLVSERDFGAVLLGDELADALWD